MSVYLEGWLYTWVLSNDVFFLFLNETDTDEKKKEPLCQRYFGATLSGLFTCSVKRSG